MRPLARLFHALRVPYPLDEDRAFDLISDFEQEIRKEFQGICPHEQPAVVVAGIAFCQRCGARVEPGAAS